MNTVKFNDTLIEGYLGLLHNLSLSQKLDLITQLTVSAKADLATKPSAFKQAFGAFESDQSAEEMIEEIRQSRLFTRQIEPF